MRLSENLHIACTGSRMLGGRASCLSGGANTRRGSARKNCTGRLFAFLRLDPTLLTIKRRSRKGEYTHGGEGETRVFFLFPPRIYIQPRQREITRKLYGVSNIRSFLSGSAAIAWRTSFAKLPGKTCQTRVRCPLPVVIYLRFVCPPAGKESAFEYSRGRRATASERG